MDSQRVPGADANIVEVRMVRAFCEIRRMALFRAIPILLCVENAPVCASSHGPITGPIGATIVCMLAQYQRRTGNSLDNILMMREFGQDRKPGVPKTKQITERMVRYSSNKMRVNQVPYSKNLTVGGGVTRRGMQDRLQTQRATFAARRHVRHHGWS